jgi:hypothetical protein
MSSQRERERQDYINHLEGQVEDQERQARKDQGRIAGYQKAAETPPPGAHVAQTDSGEVLYSGPSAGRAWAAARNHYWQTGEHASGGGSDTRERGGFRRPRRPSGEGTPT